MIENNKLTTGHAKVLVGLENAEFIARKIASKNLSVRQTENLIRSLKNFKSTKSLNKDSNVLSMENELKNKIGLNVFIKNKRNNKGQIVFEYNNLEQLNRLIEVIKSNY